MSDFYSEFINSVIILFIVFISNKIIRKQLKICIEKDSNKHKKTMLIFLRKIITYLMYVVGILISLVQFTTFAAFSITILSALGVLAAVVGLALQNSLSNLFSSFELFISRPFEVGDFIKLPEKNLSGTVEDFSLRHTVIRTIYNQREIIPNSSLNGLIIENADYVENDICLHQEYFIAYSANIDKAMEIMKEELKNICENSYLKKHKEIEFPKVRVTKWDESSINIRAYIW